MHSVSLDNWTMNSPLHNLVSDDFQAVNEHVIGQLFSDVDLIEDIGRYLVESGGKRLRPLVVLLCARCCDYQGKQHIDLATVIEFLHTATLLHDDVVDVSAMRRGKLTANEKWGNAPSVLVGDFIYSRAFQMMVSIGNMEVMNILSNATNIISEGEVLQLINARNPATTEESYMQVIHHKTAMLFEAACEATGALASITKDQQQALKLYGKHLGLAFQLIDDVLDYKGSSEELGKNIGDDLAEGKPTLPLIYTMQTGSPDDKQLIENVIRNADRNQLNAVLAAVKRSNALDYTEQQAQQQAQLAKQQLDLMPDNQYRKALMDLADFSITRTH